MDIGGGLSVNFLSEENKPTFEDYADALRKYAPLVFKFPKIITEFGRSIAAKSGWFGSRIEYTKQAGGRTIAA